MSEFKILSQLARRLIIDVRSPGEFAQGAIPGSVNLPILTDEERHQVGIAYKTLGQAAAIALGHQLVDPDRERRVAHWLAAIPATGALITCWRGGLRSSLATQWIRESQPAAPMQTIRGGYKALRAELLAVIEHDQPPWWVIAGPTGAGKSRLLSTAHAALDLEAIAHHRGSAFGVRVDRPQPTQATFENALGLQIFELRTALQAALPKPERALIEDESPALGRLRLPTSITHKIQTSPLVIIDAALDERVQRIETEYVREPLQSGVTPVDLEARLRAQLMHLERRLGRVRRLELDQKIATSFATQNHRDWIADLLRNYYDPAYSYSLARFERPVAMRGSYEECAQWIKTQFDSPLR